MKRLFIILLLLGVCHTAAAQPLITRIQLIPLSNYVNAVNTALTNYMATNAASGGSSVSGSGVTNLANSKQQGSATLTNLSNTASNNANYVAAADGLTNSLNTASNNLYASTPISCVADFSALSNRPSVAVRGFTSQNGLTYTVIGKSSNTWGIAGGFYTNNVSTNGTATYILHTSSIPVRVMGFDLSISNLAYAGNLPNISLIISSNSLCTDGANLVSPFNDAFHISYNWAVGWTIEYQSNGFGTFTSMGVVPTTDPLSLDNQIKTHRMFVDLTNSSFTFEFPGGRGSITNPLIRAKWPTDAANLAWEISNTAGTPLGVDAKFAKLFYGNQAEADAQRATPLAQPFNAEKSYNFTGNNQHSGTATFTNYVILRDMGNAGFFTWIYFDAAGTLHFRSTLDGRDMFSDGVQAQAFLPGYAGKPHGSASLPWLYSGWDLLLPWSLTNSALAWSNGIATANSTNATQAANLTTVSNQLWTLSNLTFFINLANNILSNTPTILGNGSNGGFALGSGNGVFDFTNNAAATNLNVKPRAAATGSGLTIGPNGNVGIGLTAPQTSLHATGVVRSAGIEIYDASLCRILLVQGGSTKGFIDGDTTGFTLRSAASLPINFKNGGGTQLATILDGGNFGIGTTTPLRTLQANGDIYATNGVVALYSSTTGPAWVTNGIGAMWTSNGAIYARASRVGGTNWADTLILAAP